MPDDKNQQKYRKNAEENTTKKYIPLLVRRKKKNAFANRVGKRASIMWNQYCVNVPVDGNIYVKKKKNKKLKKSESEKKKTTAAANATLH